LGVVMDVLVFIAGTFGKCGYFQRRADRG
jgi:hypothetical protein